MNNEQFKKLVETLDAISENDWGDYPGRDQEEWEKEQERKKTSTKKNLGQILQNLQELVDSLADSSQKKNGQEIIDDIHGYFNI